MVFGKIFHFKKYLSVILIHILLIFSSHAQNQEQQKTEMLKSQIENFKKNENSLDFPLEILSEQIPEDFIGALVICSPFCEVVSVRLEDKEWKPDLKNIRSYSQNMKFIDIEDPIFKLLFPDKKAEIQKISIQRKIELTKIEVEKKTKKTKNEKTAKALKAPIVNFNNAIRFASGARITNLQASTNNNVQADFVPSNILANVFFEVGYMRGQPFHFINKWWQVDVNFMSDLLGTTSALKSNSELSLSKNKLTLNLLIKEKNYSWGPRWTNLNQAYKTSKNELTSFSFDENLMTIGGAYKANRYFISFDYGIKSSLSEQQPFRDQLKAAQYYLLEGTYCQQEKTFQDVKFIPCYFANYMVSESTATFNPIYNSSELINLKRSEISMGFIAYFGEDFLR